MAAAPKIVLSYRRDDTSGHALHLCEELTERFGEDSVFMDIDALEPGGDFPKAIEHAVGSCDAFIALIGRRWLTSADTQGRRRLDNPKDFVRLEIEAALWREVLLIPVLVQDAEMPSEDDLPESLKPLAHKHALEIRDSSWKYDVDQLIAALRKRIRTDERGHGIALQRPKAPVLYAGGGVAAAVLGTLAYMAFTGNGDDGNGGGPIPGPDEERIAFVADGRLQVVAVDDGEAKVVRRVRAGASAPDWSPDGRRLAYARAEQIWVVDLASGAPRALTRGGSPAWSPDGETIAFNLRASAGDRPDVHLIGADGSEPENLTGDDSGAAPAWSPRGERIVYQRRTALWTMDADGERRRPLPVDEPGTKLRPSWSSTGRIAVAIFTKDGASDIWVIDPETGDADNVTEGEFREPQDPSWSPDGRRLAFAAEDGVWILDLEGGDSTKVADADESASPAWSPSAEG